MPSGMEDYIKFGKIGHFQFFSLHNKTNTNGRTPTMPATHHEDQEVVHSLEDRQVVHIQVVAGHSQAHHNHRVVDHIQVDHILVVDHTQVEVHSHHSWVAVHSHHSWEGNRRRAVVHSRVVVAEVDHSRRGPGRGASQQSLAFRHQCLSFRFTSIRVESS